MAANIPPINSGAGVGDNGFALEGTVAEAAVAAGSGALSRVSLTSEKSRAIPGPNQPPESLSSMLETPDGTGVR